MSTIKRKRVSKRSKRSWRKHIDVKDVDDFLEDQRLEERLGNFSLKKNEELFSIDVKGASGGQAESNKPRYNVKVNLDENEKPSYRLRETELPRCYAILGARSAVPDPIVKRNRPKTREQKRHPAVKKIFQDRSEKGILTAKEKNLLRKKEIERVKKEKKPKIGEFAKDIWGQSSQSLLENGGWVRKNIVKHTLRNTGIIQKEIPVLIQRKCSSLPSIELPHPGLSYNPSLKAHNEILTAVVEKEKELEKEEKHIKRVTTDMFSKVKPEKAEKDWLSEMSAGLMQESDSSDSDGEYKTVNPPAKNKKKTLQKRRRLREAILLKEQLHQQKIEKRKISDIYKLRQFNKTFEKDDEVSKRKSEQRAVLKKQKEFTTKVLGHNKFEEPEVDFILPEDLKGSLREMKSHGNLLADRYKSLQRRNILEPALKHRKKKKKVKKFERSSAKMGWEPKGY